jgi:hypothetical protein
MNISYLPILHTINLQVYGQANGNSSTIKQLPTVQPYESPNHMLSQVCYRVTNFTQNSTATLSIYDNVLSLLEDSIAPTGAMVTINGQVLNLTVNSTQTFMSSYYADLMNVSYQVTPRAVALLVCGSQPIPQVTTVLSTATTTVPETTVPATGTGAPLPLIVPAAGVGVIAAIIVGFMATRNRRGGSKRRKR